MLIFHNQLNQPVSKKRCVEGLFIPKDEFYSTRAIELHGLYNRCLDLDAS